MKRIWDAVIEWLASLFRTKAKIVETDGELRANFVELVDTLQKLLDQANERLERCQDLCQKLLEGKFGRNRPKPDGP